MYLKELTSINFKNLQKCSLTFSPKLNCIYGNNGVGKTNLLDAIYTLSMTKSFFGFPDSFSINHSEQVCSLIGNYEMDDNTYNKISINIQKLNSSPKNILSEKKIKRNEKSYTRFSEHIGLIPVVMVSPFDTAIVNSASQERRKFINQLISQIDKEYLNHLKEYNRLILERNKLLKNEEYFSKELIESIDHYLCKCADYIFKKREEFTQLLNNSIENYYSKLCGGMERVRIIYDTDLHKGDYISLLNKYLEKDRLYKYTTCGIHRDDFIFEMEVGDQNFYPIKRCSSQGQQKSFLIALKLAQFSIMSELNGGVSPILLLDDIFDKLDINRVEYLLSLVSGDSFGQIFITDSNKVRIRNLVDKIGSQSKEFTVEEGNIMIS